MTAAFTHNASNLAPGYKLDRYELLCPIAEGGMASVWVARQRGKHGFEKLVAIKTILPVFASDARFQQMFLDEARIASRIEHANVAQILDLGEEHDVLYLAMEYVDGDALSKLNHACRKDGGKIAPGILLRILSDTCAGLHEAHELLDGSGKPLEIVHRDVRPHNVLINTKGIAKLIDFGIAKARSRAGGETNSGVLKGKIQYMAPEQALGRPVDRRADVWAVGVILYYLLSGKPPYEGENQLATLHLLASGRPPVPLAPSVHSAIAKVVRKTLEYHPADRYQTAAELREALEGAMIEARVQTSQVDVAAFVAKHLAEQAEKRRRSVDLALAAASERRRVQDLLRPTNDISSSGLTPAATESAMHDGFRVSAPSSGSLRAAREATRAEVPVPRWLPGGSEQSPSSRSFGTLGSASLDAEPPGRARSMKPMAAIALLGVAGAAATIISFALLRSKAPAPAPAAGAQTVATQVAPAPAPVAPPPSPPASAPQQDIPLLAASALPRAKEQPPAPLPRATPAPATTAAKPKPASKSQTVDDGF